MDRYKIAIVVGSLRKDSINLKVAKSLCAMAHERLDCDIVPIGDLPLYNQESDGDPPEQYVRFREEIGRAHGVLFVTPEYNRGVQQSSASFGLRCKTSSAATMRGRAISKMRSTRSAPMRRSIDCPQWVESGHSRWD